MTIRDTITDMFERALGLVDAGDVSDAQALYERALAMLASTDDSEQLDALTAAAKLALRLRALGDLPGARKLLERVVEGFERTLGPKHLDTLDATAHMAMNLFHMGDLAAAAVLQERVFEGRAAALGDEHPATCKAANNLAATLHHLGDETRAKALLRHAFEASEGARDYPLSVALGANLTSMGGDKGRPHQRQIQEGVATHALRAFGAHDPIVLSICSTLAKTMREEGDLAGARALQEHALEAAKRALGDEDNSILDVTLHLAETMRDQGDLVGARALQERVLEASERKLGREHATTLNAAVDLASTVRDLGDTAEAIRLNMNFLPRLAVVGDVGLMPSFFAMRIVYWLLQDSLNYSVAPAWVEEGLRLLPLVSRNLQHHMEARQTSVAKSFAVFYEVFHQTWLLLCAKWAPRLVPQAMAPLHGLEAWSITVDALVRAQSTGTLTRPEQDFLHAREVLANVRARIGEIDAVIARLSGIVAAAENGEKRSARTQLAQAQAQQEVMLNEERDCLDGYRSTRESLAASNPVFAATVHPVGRTAEDYASGLQPHEGILVLCRLKDTPLAAAITTTAQVVSRVEGLLRLAQNAERLDGQLRANGHFGGLRDYDNHGVVSDARFDLQDRPTIVPSATTNEAEEYRLLSLADLAREALWNPIVKAFPQVSKWHIVTGPGLHSVPLDIGRPECVEARFYCGLPAFWRLRQQPVPCSESHAVDAVVDASWNHASPIPFVEVEAALLERFAASTGPVRRLEGHNLLNASKLSPCVHVACHGRKEGSESGGYGVLLLDGNVLDPAGALHLPAGMSELFVSACLGGVVASTEGGDAQGVVASLQLRGIPAIIACLAPVHDFYMPLLVAMYWHARGQGKAPSEALALAKQQLRQGNWPEVLLAPLREVYVDQMIEVLSRARVGARRLPAMEAIAHSRARTTVLHSFKQFFMRATRTETTDEDSTAARCVANTVGGWLLPDDVRERYFSSIQMEAQTHRDFSVAWCEHPEKQRELANNVAARLIHARHDWPASARAAIEHICGFTVYFGN